MTHQNASTLLAQHPRTFADYSTNTRLSISHLTHAFDSSLVVEMSVLTSITRVVAKNSSVHFVSLFDTPTHTCLTQAGSMTHFIGTAYLLNLDCTTVKTAAI